jgi:hypothetical protein
MWSDFEVNTVGPIVLYQAFASLLSASQASRGSVFVVVSSVLGQIADSLPYEYNAYGFSKVSVNLFAKKLDQANPKMVAFPISWVFLQHSLRFGGLDSWSNSRPGVADTEMGKAGAASVGLTVEQIGGITASASVSGMMRVIDIAAKESHGGKFWSYTGDQLTY